MSLFTQAYLWLFWRWHQFRGHSVILPLDTILCDDCVEQIGQRFMSLCPRCWDLVDAVYMERAKNPIPRGRRPSESCEETWEE